MDESKLTGQVLRGELAKAFIENPLFDEAFEAASKTIDEAWRNSFGDEDELRKRLYLMRRLNANLRQFYVTHIVNGKIAASQLTKLKEPSKIRRLITNHG